MVVVRSMVTARQHPHGGAHRRGERAPQRKAVSDERKPKGGLDPSHHHGEEQGYSSEADQKTADEQFHLAAPSSVGGRPSFIGRLVRSRAFFLAGLEPAR